MTTASTSTFLRRLTRGAAAETLRDQSDRQLVERLLAGGGEAAFEALVRRHGPMVYRVCWRVLQQEQDTEDAFQATFLILAQQVRTVRRPASLASWLHGIARRVALKARAQGATRRRHEQNAATASFPPEEAPWREMRAVLDAELDRLPEEWRLPLLFCYLEGQTQDEAAKQLGWSQRTLRRRLEEARAALGRRLTGRGVLWPAALSAVLLSDCVVPALAPRLLGSTVEAAALVAAGKAVPATAVSANVAALTEGVLKAMFTSRLKIATAALVLVSALAVGVGGLLYQTQAAEPQPPAKAEKPAAGAGDKPQVAFKPILVKDEAQLFPVVWIGDGKTVATVGHTAEVVVLKKNRDGMKKALVTRPTIKLWDPTTGKLKRSLGEEKYRRVHNLTLSQDRQTAALSITGKYFDREKGELVEEYGHEVRVMNARTWGLKYHFTDKDVGMSVERIALSPDGKRLALGGHYHPLVDEPRGRACLKLWDVTKRKLIERKPKEGEKTIQSIFCIAFSPDGNLVAAGTTRENGGTIRLFDGRTGEPKAVWKDPDDRSVSALGIAFSPDGKTLASVGQGKNNPGSRVNLWDVPEAKVRQTLERGRCWAVAFSPDGKLLATAGGVEREKGKLFPAGWRFEVVLWDVKSGEMNQALAANVPVWSLAFSPDGKTLAAAGGNLGSVKDGVKTGGEISLIPLK